MSFLRKAFGHDDDAPPPIQRRPRRGAGPEARPPEAPAPTPPPAARGAAPSAPAPQAEAVSVLAPGLQLEGALTGQGTVRVEGRFRGRVQLDGTLIVGPTGRVEGETLVARQVVVEGLVRGPLLAEYVEIGATGKVWGDVTTVTFVTREGAFLRGQVRMEEAVTLPWEAEADEGAPAGEAASPPAAASAPAEPVPPTPPPDAEAPA